jgi:hypothetical protein
MENWSQHLEAAVFAFNNRILPALKFSPDELLYGLVVNTPRTPVDEAMLPVYEADAGLQMVYMGQLRMDGYTKMVDHVVRHKAQFDKKILVQSPKEVIFKTGSLVQQYVMKYETGATFLVERKMVPMWSAPRRITSRAQNLYKIETLEDLPISGRFSSRLLRQFIPRRGTILDELQHEWVMGLEELRIEDIEDDKDTGGSDDIEGDNKGGGAVG